MFFSGSFQLKKNIEASKIFRENLLDRRESFPIEWVRRERSLKILDEDRWVFLQSSSNWSRMRSPGRKNKNIFRRWLKWIERLASSCNKHESSSTSIAKKIRKTNAMIEKVTEEWKGWSIFHKRLVSSSWQLHQVDQDLSLFYGQIFLSVACEMFIRSASEGIGKTRIIWGLSPSIVARWSTHAIQV